MIKVITIYTNGKSKKQEIQSIKNARLNGLKEGYIETISTDGIKNLSFTGNSGFEYEIDNMVPFLDYVLIVDYRQSVLSRFHLFEMHLNEKKLCV